MQQEQLLNYVKSLVGDKDQPIDQTTLLFKEKILDSMNILNLIGYVEKQLGRKLTNDEIIMANFESVNKIMENLLLNDKN